MLLLLIDSLGNRFSKYLKPVLTFYVTSFTVSCRN